MSSPKLEPKILKELDYVELLTVVDALAVAAHTSVEHFSTARKWEHEMRGMEHVPTTTKTYAKTVLGFEMAALLIENLAAQVSKLAEDVLAAQIAEGRDGKNVGKQ